MRNTKAALVWITDLLKKHNIQFQISGGLAARIYGSTRSLEDIDIDMPEDQFNLILPEIREFITYGPEHLVDDHWDLQLITLNYKGQEIDLSGSDHTKIFNISTKKWKKLTEDLSKAVVKDVLGLQLPVISREKLLAYKKALSREVDIIDVREIENNKFT